MKYEITQDLLQVILRLIYNAKEIGCSYVETNTLIQQLQALPKIEEKPTEKKDTVPPVK